MISCSKDRSSDAPPHAEGPKELFAPVAVSPDNSTRVSAAEESRGSESENPVDPVAIAHGSESDPVQSNNQFALAFLRNVQSREEGNFLCSPFSIWSTLAMASLGAEGETRHEMLAALALPEGHPHLGVGGWIRSLQMARDVDLSFANRLWAGSELSLRPNFLAEIEANYGASVGTVAFDREPERARLEINRWISKQTRGRIADLLGSGDLDRRTRLVLTNAVYFHGEWKTPFDPDDTSRQEFATGTSGTVYPQTMTNLLASDYFENDRWQAVRLPYSGDDLSLLLVIPQQKDHSMKDLLMSEKAFTEILSEIRPEQRVLIQLPRFDITTRLNPGETIGNLGMSRAFTNAAEFGRMCEEPVKLDAIIQQAWISVGEKGTEAAAATAVMKPAGSAPPKVEDLPKQFIADHPFLFFLIENKSGGILFTGRVSDPTV